MAIVKVDWLKACLKVLCFDQLNEYALSWITTLTLLAVINNNGMKFLSIVFLEQINSILLLHEIIIINNTHMHEVCDSKSY